MLRSTPAHAARICRRRALCTRYGGKVGRHEVPVADVVTDSMRAVSTAIVMYCRLVLRARHALALAVLGATVGGCQQTPPEAAPPTTRLPGDTWFCAPAEGSAARPWECVESTPIAAARQADRQSSGAQVPTDPQMNVSAAQQSTAPVRPAAPAQVVAEAASRPRSTATDPTDPTDPLPVERPVNTPSPAADTPHVRIQDLPPDLWTIQLGAFSERERLQRFAQAHDLWGLTAARVRTDAGQFFVLLWGVYQTRDQAEEYARRLPASLQGVEPWIRRVGPLQDAMRRAETGSD